MSFASMTKQERDAAYARHPSQKKHRKTFAEMKPHERDAAFARHLHPKMVFGIPTETAAYEQLGREMLRAAAPASSTPSATHVPAREPRSDIAGHDGLLPAEGGGAARPAAVPDLGTRRPITPDTDIIAS